MDHFPQNFRRVRQNPAIRRLLSDTQLNPAQFIQPYFFYEKLKQREDLSAIHGQYKHTTDSLLREIELGLENQINSVLLFPIQNEKRTDDFTYDFDLEVFRGIKHRFGQDIVLFADLCLCSNTQSGHCGYVNNHGVIENNSSVQELARKAGLYADAGVDVISPSDMMDDRILAIRSELNRGGHEQKLIMSYSTKFSSCFYGPFREAADSTPQAGDRKSYQISPDNLKDAIRCSIRDLDQGADILMVKPVGSYLDILLRLKQHPALETAPLAAYQVSGEYQGLKVMADQGLLNFEAALVESLIAIKRAGADLIISYGANNLVKTLQGL